MHQDVALGLPHAREGKVYLEDGGCRVLHVWPQIDQEDVTAVAALRQELDGLLGGLHGYDRIELHMEKR